MCKLCDIRYILHVSALIQVNRFLALTNFEGGFAAIFTYDGRMEAYDNFMVQKFAPGTLKASYAYIRRFVDWLVFAKKITLEVKEQVITFNNYVIIMKRCLQVRELYILNFSGLHADQKIEVSH